MITPFVLSASERESFLWKRLAEHLESLRDDARKRNDNPNLTFDKTQCLRGRIECLEIVLGFGKEPPTRKLATAPRQGTPTSMMDEWRPTKES